MSEAKNNLAQNEKYTCDDYMRVPVYKTRWQTVKDGFYNPKEGTIIGKTGKQWGITGLFYLIFFSGLAVFCALCYKGLMASLSLEKPRWTLEGSLIGTNPGLGFRPLPRTTAERSLIWYNASNATQVQDWISNINQFLEHYLNSSKLPNAGRNQQICSYDHQIVQEGHVCAVDVNKWGPCSSAEGYGFNNSSPCVFIKLNRIYGWVPDYYNDPENLPSEMPKSLRDRIRSFNSTWLNTVWVSCEGAAPFDRENIGELEYYPKSHGFPGYYYPYENIPGYLSPLVAVHFRRPQRNVIIAVECRAWAKNIEHISANNMGMVHFELLIDHELKVREITRS